MFLLLVACFAMGFGVSCPERARAQEGSSAPVDSSVAPPSDADSDALQKAMAASDKAVATALGKETLYDPDRFEFGVGFPRDYFDWLGTFAYERRVYVDPRFIHTIHAEVSYGHKDYLREGAMTFAWLLRPKKFWRPEWKVRPVIEGGIGGDVSVQFADLTGFDDWSSHAHAFVKSRLQVGAETDLSRHFGLAIRGRMVVPAHRPMDYAQVVLFLR